MAGKFVVRGSGENIVLERYNDAGEATSARPGSPEELLMYNGIVLLQRKVALALEFARELSVIDSVQERREFLESQFLREPADAKLVNPREFMVSSVSTA